MQTFPVARAALACQLTAPVAGSAASIRSLIPAGVLTALASRQIIEVRLHPVTTACELRHAATIAGVALLADQPTAIPCVDADMLLIQSSTGATVTVGALLLVA